MKHHHIQVNFLLYQIVNYFLAVGPVGSEKNIHEEFDKYSRFYYQQWRGGRKLKQGLSLGDTWVRLRDKTQFRLVFSDEVQKRTFKRNVLGKANIFGSK